MTGRSLARLRTMIVSSLPTRPSYVKHRIFQGAADGAHHLVGPDRVVREGQGLAFFYLLHNTQIVAVPTSSIDAKLVINETTTTSTW